MSSAAATSVLPKQRVEGSNPFSRSKHHRERRQRTLYMDTLTERVNFAVEQVMDTSKPGVALIVDRVVEAGDRR